MILLPRLYGCRGLDNYAPSQAQTSAPWELPVANQTFLIFYFFLQNASWNIWVNKVGGNEKRWQLFTVRRYYFSYNESAAVDFRLETSTTKRDFILKLTELLRLISLYSFQEWPKLNFP